MKDDETGHLEPRLTLDTVGRRCPIPVIELARHLADVEVGEVLAVLSDDAAAALDVPAWCRMRNQDYAGAQPAADRPGTVAYHVRRAH